MSIFKQIISSVYDPDYYEKNVLKEKFSSSLSYFISLAMIISVITSGVFSFRLLPFVKNGINNFVPGLVEYFPKDLEITIKDGQLSTNQEDATIIPLSGATSTASTTEEFPGNFLVVDTKSPFNEERFKEANTLFYITADTVYVAGESGKIGDSESLKEVPNATINREQINDWINEARPLLSWLAFIIVVGFFIAGLWASLLVMVSLLVVTLFIMLMGRLQGRKLSYKTSYRVGLHAVTLSMMLIPVAGLSPAIILGVIPVPALFVLLTLLVVWLNLKQREIPKSNDTPLQ